MVLKMEMEEVPKKLKKENSELIVSATMYCDQLEKASQNTDEMNWTVEDEKEISSIIADLREAISLQKYDAIKEYLEQVKSFLNMKKSS